jgi:hypothetical protein
MVLVLVAGLALAAGASILRAQSSCRGQCDIDLQNCKNSCWGAQTFDDCTSDCQNLYQQCVMSCN